MLFVVAAAAAAAPPPAATNTINDSDNDSDHHLSSPSNHIKHQATNGLRFSTQGLKNRFYFLCEVEQVCLVYPCVFVITSCFIRVRELLGGRPIVWSSVSLLALFFFFFQVQDKSRTTKTACDQSEKQEVVLATVHLQGQSECQLPLRTQHRPAPLSSRLFAPPCELSRPQVSIRCSYVHAVLPTLVDEGWLAAATSSSAQLLAAESVFV